MSLTLAMPDVRPVPRMVAWLPGRDDVSPGLLTPDKLTDAPIPPFAISPLSYLADPTIPQDNTSRVSTIHDA
jgi:hypothetical protein